MAQETKYKRTLSGSVGAGMGALFNPSGRRYYILEHKVNSQYHRAGESQEIIVDDIEIGRDPKCQVRFDESFATVSRRHAAIVKDGDGWRLIKLSKTNKVLVNGIPVENKLLNNGDEIQLALNGPRIGFILPTGNKSTVGSIALTRRLSLFREQALRPYKTMLTVLTVVLLLCIVTCGYVIYSQGQLINHLDVKMVTMNADFERSSREAEQRRIQDSINYANIIESNRAEFAEEIRRQQDITRAAIDRIKRGADLSVLLQESSVFDDVYLIMAEKVVMVVDDEEYEIDNARWQATGFLLKDGRFVTARHCVEGWLYGAYNGDDALSRATRAAATYENVRMKAYLRAVSTNKKNQFRFTSDDFVVDGSKDRIVNIGNDDSGNSLYWRFPYPVSSEWPEEMWSTDWAYTTKTGGARGKLQFDANLSRSLLPMQQLLVLGFPKGIGVGDSGNMVDPISYELRTSRQGLANNGCILHSRGTDHGNSGGPIFAVNNRGELTVVGIVSRGDSHSQEYNWAVPICHIYK